MTTAVIFVHGIGVRAESYNLTCDQIARRLSVNANYQLQQCLWGEASGCLIPEVLRSIPGTPVMAKAAFSEQEDVVAFWDLLLADPTVELVVGTPPTPAAPFGNSAGNIQSALEAKLKYEHAAIAAALGPLSLMPTGLHQAHHELLGDVPYARASAQPVNSAAVAAVVRAALAQALATRGAEVPFSATAAEQAVIQIAAEVSVQKGFLGETSKRVVARIATRQLRRSRETITRRILPFVGDVLIYQSLGDKIRGHLNSVFASTIADRVIILGHSLGGIAAVEWCIEAARKVDLLVTVGSQSPFFYELGTLRSLPPTSKLPSHFPRWLNLYDPNDFLGFVAAPVFQDDRIVDVPVDTGAPFPASHSAYWTSDAFWEIFFQHVR